MLAQQAVVNRRLTEIWEQMYTYQEKGNRCTLNNEVEGVA